jgi:uncharacterized protein (TIGR02284 family)
MRAISGAAICSNLIAHSCKCAATASNNPSIAVIRQRHVECNLNVSEFAFPRSQAMNRDTATLNDMIEVLNDGRAFYQEAASHVKRPDLRNLFERMARTKQSIAEDLRTAVVADGAKPPEGGSFAGSLRKAYGEMRAALSTHKDYQYVAQLEEFEDRILRSFKDAVEKSDDVIVQAIAHRYMLEVTRDHDEMSTLKHAAER